MFIYSLKQAVTHSFICRMWSCIQIKFLECWRSLLVHTRSNRFKQDPILYFFSLMNNVQIPILPSFIRPKHWEGDIVHMGVGVIWVNFVIYTPRFYLIISHLMPLFSALFRILAGRLFLSIWNGILIFPFEWLWYIDTLQVDNGVRASRPDLQKGKQWPLWNLSPVPALLH